MQYSESYGKLPATYLSGTVMQPYDIRICYLALMIIIRHNFKKLLSFLWLSHFTSLEFN